MRQRNVRLPDDGGITVVDASIVELALGSMPPEAVAAELSLLRMELVEGIKFWHPAADHGLLLRARDFAQSARRSLKGDTVTVDLSCDHLDHWLAFFLRHYRDGMAEVDHLDVELERDDGDAVLDLIVKIGSQSRR